MNEVLEFVLRVVLIGTGATVVMDLWAACRTRFFSVPALSYGLVGRWLGHLAHGQFAHESIAKAPPIRGELWIGWAAHYAIGIIFAALLIAIWGLEWARSPTLLPALIIGLVTLAAPFFLMQPGMGAGIAASRTPNPNQARLRSFLTHLVFGIGLYISALLASLLI